MFSVLWLGAALGSPDCSLVPEVRFRAVTKTSFDRRHFNRSDTQSENPAALQKPLFGRSRLTHIEQAYFTRLIQPESPLTTPT
jgi:hypothetical protein